MSLRRIIVSAATHARLGVAREELIRLAPSSETVVLAPSAGAASDFVRACCANAGGVSGVHRLTLAHLAANLGGASLAGGRVAPVGGLAIEALAARAIHECCSKTPLSYFERVASAPGFRAALARTLGELRLAGIDPQALAATGLPGADLARLLETYERELRERSLADPAAMYRMAAAAAGETNHALLDIPAFFLDLALASAAERDLAAAVARRSPAVIATAAAGDEDAIRALESMLGVVAERLEESESNSLARLRRYVFLTDRPVERPLDASIEFFSAGGEALECVEIARRARAFSEQGVPFDRMAILLRDPDLYLPLVEDALRRAGVPAYPTRGVLRPDPAGRAFLALLDCKAEHLSAARFAEYLSLGQAPSAPGVERWVASEDEAHARFAAPEAANGKAPEPPPDTLRSDGDQPVLSGSVRAPAAWEKLLVEAAVIGGRDRWERRLRGLEAEYELRLRRLDDHDDAHRAQIERQLERLRNLASFALPLIAALDALPRQALWADWLDALAGLAATALRDPDPVLAVLSELEPMGDVGPAGLDEVRAALADRLRYLRREPPQRRYGSVFVSTAGEAAARSFAVVFLPGLAEGIFPRKAAEDPLLLDEYRRKLGADLATREKRVERERLLLRIAAGAAESALVVSYPRLDLGQGRARVPSFYALEVLRAAEGRLPDLREFERRAAGASTTRLGWPAPKDATQAIDDAEFDLATLEPLQNLGAAEVKGRGRYLLNASPILSRALRTRWRRWDRRGRWSAADGLVDPAEPARGVLASHRLSARAYSPSALQHFALCPYRFLLYGIHQIRPREEAAPLERLDPLTRGALIHEAQREFFRAATSAALVPIEAPRLQDALDCADRSLERVAAEYEERLAPAILEVWRGEIESIRTDLRAWVLELVSIHAEWRPWRFEFAFGLAHDDARDPASVADDAVILNRYRMRGSIDLVERNARGDQLRITDHKTGRAPELPPRVTAGGEILQPVLYGLAAEQILGAPVASSMLFYCTQRGGYSTVTIPLDARARQVAAEVIRIIDGAVADAFLPASPRKGACANCDYRLICGPYEEIRASGKQQDRMGDLDLLRSLS